jgi:hypothetical protein
MGGGAADAAASPVHHELEVARMMQLSRGSSPEPIQAPMELPPELEPSPIGPALPEGEQVGSSRTDREGLSVLDERNLRVMTAAKQEEADRLRIAGIRVKLARPRSPIEADPFMQDASRATLETAVDARMQLEAFFNYRFPGTSLDRSGAEVSKAKQARADFDRFFRADLSGNTEPLPDTMTELTTAEIEYIRELQLAAAGADYQVDVVEDQVVGPSVLPKDPEVAKEFPTVEMPLYNRRVNQAFSRAAERWRQRGIKRSPCGGNAQVYLTNRLPKSAESRADLPFTASTTIFSDTRGKPIECVIRIKAVYRSLDAESLANTAEHEYGHGLGYCHSPDPENVMWGGDVPGDPGHLKNHLEGCKKPDPDWLG